MALIKLNTRSLADDTVTTDKLGSDLSLSGSVTVNDAGEDKDFRVEGVSEPHLLFANAGQNALQVGASSGITAGDAHLQSYGTRALMRNVSTNVNSAVMVETVFGVGGTNNQHDIIITNNTTSATSGIIEIMCAGYNERELDYAYGFYSTTGFTSFTSGAAIRNAGRNLTSPSISLTSAGVIRVRFSSSLTYPIFKVKYSAHTIQSLKPQPQITLVAGNV